MTLTKEVQNQLFSADTNRLICLPTRTTYSQPVAIAPAGPVGPAGSVATANSPSGASNNGTSWTDDEHARFLLGLEMFPSGPWKAIANIVGTRTARQTMSHAQKYRQKIARRQRGGQQQQPLDASHSSSSASNSNTSSPVATLMTESLADLHLSSEQIDELIQSLFEDGDGGADDDDDTIVITSEDMEAIMSTHM